MDPALRAAATGMQAQQTRIEVISNNLANVNTTGFKRSRAHFEDLLYQTQQGTFQYHVETFGLAHAERVSARPGHSEHQLGATVDLSSASVGFELLEAFGETPEGRWLVDQAHEFGFALSYPAGLEAESKVVPIVSNSPKSRWWVEPMVMYCELSNGRQPSAPSFSKMGPTSDQLIRSVETP